MYIYTLFYNLGVKELERGAYASTEIDLNIQEVNISHRLKSK